MPEGSANETLTLPVPLAHTALVISTERKGNKPVRNLLFMNSLFRYFLAFIISIAAGFSQVNPCVVDPPTRVTSGEDFQLRLRIRNPTTTAWFLQNDLMQGSRRRAPFASISLKSFSFARAAQVKHVKPLSVFVRPSEIATFLVDVDSPRTVGNLPFTIVMGDGSLQIRCEGIVRVLARDPRPTFRLDPAKPLSEKPASIEPRSVLGLTTYDLLLPGETVEYYKYGKVNSQDLVNYEIPWNGGDATRTSFRWYRALTRYENRPDESRPFSEKPVGQAAERLPFSLRTSPRLGLYATGQHPLLKLSSFEAPFVVYRGCSPSLLCQQSDETLVRKNGVCKVPTGKWPTPNNPPQREYLEEIQGELPGLTSAAEDLASREIRGINGFEFTAVFAGHTTSTPSYSSGDGRFATEAVFFTDERCAAGGREIGFDYRLDLPRTNPASDPAGKLRFYYSWYTNCGGGYCLSETGTPRDAQVRMVSLNGLNPSQSHTYQVTHANDFSGHWLEVKVDPLNLSVCSSLKQVDPVEQSGEADPDSSVVVPVEILTPGKCHFRIKIHGDFDSANAFSALNRGWLHHAVLSERFDTFQQILRPNSLSVSSASQLTVSNMKVTAYQPRFDLTSFGPQNFSGSQGTFSITASATGGYQNIGKINILANTWLDGNQACHLVYIQGAPDLLALVLDNGTLAERNIGGSGALENSQCTVHQGESISKNGNNLTISNLTITAKPGWVNTSDPTALEYKQFYVAIRSEGDDLFPGTGWMPAGIWKVTPVQSSSRFESVQISGSANQPTLNVQVKQNPATPLTDLWIIVNDFLDAPGACYAVVFPVQGVASFRTDFGDDEFRTVNQGGSDSNSYCRLSQFSISSPDSSTVNLAFTLDLYAPITGPRTVWAAAVSYDQVGAVVATTNWMPIAAIRRTYP